jgi:hypothetical protein
MIALREFKSRLTEKQALYAKTPSAQTQQLRRLGKLARICGLESTQNR